MVQIITDSSVLYTSEDARKNGFEAIPLCVSVADFDGRDMHLDMKAFYARIAEGNNPKSSQPPIGEVVDAFEKYADCDIINISMADGLSGTYQSACMAKEMVENKDRITVLNSKTLCGPHRYMVESAQKMKEAGHSAEEIIEWLERVIEAHKSYLIPQDFDFLRRGGRLTPMAATLGSVLKLKPIMTPTPDGKKLDKIGVKRTMSAAIKEVIADMKRLNASAEKHVFYVSHADTIKDAEQAIAMIKNEFPGADVRMLELGAAFVTQGGPKCIAMQFIEKL